MNNIVYATASWMIEVPSQFGLDNNVYWTTAGSPPLKWQVDGTNYLDFKT